MALILNSESFHGDYHFHEGVNEALTEAKLLPNSLLLRSPCPHEEVVRGQIEELLAMSPRPSGFIVRLPQWTEIVAEVARKRDLKIPRDVEIVFKSAGGPASASLKFPRAELQMSSREHAQVIGRMLAQLRRGVPLSPTTVVVSYDLSGTSLESR